MAAPGKKPSYLSLAIIHYFPEKYRELLREGKERLQGIERHRWNRKYREVVRKGIERLHRQLNKSAMRVI
jgi:predicted DNA-binding protein (UPF0278 family)